MRRPHPAWKVLGIEPTSDTRAIRLAYTARLKAIDPEADPHAFVTLREAFDAAKVQAQWLDTPDVEEEAEAPIWSGPAQVIEDDGFRNGAVADPPNSAADDPDRHTRALASLLYSSDAQWPTSTQQAEMLMHWRAILADPRMEEISYFADTERWLSALIADRIPFADPLVRPAVDHFAWLGTDGTIHQTQAIFELIYRYRLLEFLDTIREPGSPNFEAWQELTTPAGPNSIRGRISVKKVHRLLHFVRVAYPDIEGCFDSTRLDLWDRRRTAPPPEPVAPAPPKRFGDQVSGRVIATWLAVGAVLLLLGVFAGTSPSYRPSNDPRTLVAPPMAPGPPLDGMIGDIDLVLEARFGGALDIGTIAAKNPALNARLEAIWTDEKAQGGDRETLARQIDRLLDDWYRLGVRSGSAALLADYHRLILDMGRAVRDHRPTACKSFLDGNRRWDGELGMPKALREREEGLIARTALETDGKWRDYGSATIPAGMIDTVARHARVKRVTVESWIERREIGDNYCGVSLAMIEAVLARPRGEVTKLMRVL